MQSEVALRHLPEGTTVLEQMRKLQEPVEARVPWAQRFGSAHPPHITKEVFEEFMRLLFASLYVFSPQGRVSGNQLNFTCFLRL
jgi:hypothetical protein